MVVNLRVVLAAVLGAALSSLVLWWIARRSAARDTSQTPLAELSRRYRPWEVAGVALLLMAIAVSWLALLWLVQLYPAPDAAVAYRLTVHPFYWGVVAFFVGNLLATAPTHFLYAWLMGEDFAQFRAYQARKFGFDSRRWMLPFYLVFGAASLAAIVFLLDWYVLIGANGIEINDFPKRSARRHYAYSQVLQIRTAERVETKSGAIQNRFTVVFQFDDGRHWSSRRDAGHTSEKHLRDLTAYVSRQSTLPIVELAVLQQSEL